MDKGNSEGANHPKCHSPMKQNSAGIGDRSHHPVVWYERTINVTKDKNVLLHF